MTASLFDRPTRPAIRYGDRLTTALPLRRRPDGAFDLVVVDLFCGAGGTSTGLVEAVELLEKVFGVKIHLRIIAVNHWPVAIETHSANHSFAQHHCSGLTGIDPRVVIPGPLDILIASPECTHHSNARGGKPMDDQSRSSGDDVVRWIELKRPGGVLIENVREYRSWGPLIGTRDSLRPDPRRKGEFYQRFLQQIRDLGYTVDDTNLTAADFGAPTTRTRLFVYARRGDLTPVFPAPTHGKAPAPAAGLEPWRTARQDVIDWSDRGTSIFNRKKPLAWKTMWRIAAGLLKYSELDVRAVFVKLYGTGKVVGVDLPCPAITGGGNHIFLAQPFVIGQQSGAVARSVDAPVPAVAAKGAISKVEPNLIQYNGTADAASVDEPAGTVTGKPRFGLAEPFMTAHFGERPDQEPRTHSVDAPAPTVTHRGAGDLATPFITEYHDDVVGAERVRGTDEPIPTLDCSNRFGCAQPFLVGAGGPEGMSRQPHGVDEPIGTVVGENHRAVANPFMVTVNHGADARSASPEARTKSVASPGPVVSGSGVGTALPPPFMMSAGGPEVGPRTTDDPAHTVLTRDHIGVAIPELMTPAEEQLLAPFAMHVTHTDRPGADPGKRTKSVDEPTPTITTAKRGELAIIQVTLVKYTHNILAQEPQNGLLLTFADGTQWLLDVFFRMLRYRELARAQRFPDSYRFFGTTADIVKQIGNAVPCKMARSLCYALLLQLPEPDEIQREAWS